MNTDTPFDFEVSLPGKWVLSGEHAVLRGAPAVALPHPTVGLRLKFERDQSDNPGLKVEPREVQLVIQNLIRRAFELAQIPFDELFVRGKLTLASSIPMGAGLGSSAALCVAITRWLAPTLKIAVENEIQFATQLEHIFHGNSSGMDVAVIASGRPVRFVRGEAPSPLRISSLPKFTFHDTGLRSKTSDCVKQVTDLHESNAELAIQADRRMNRASQQIADALYLYDHGKRDQGLKQLASGMFAAQQCFEDWGLVPDSVRVMIQNLMDQGALAVKLTGAGAGGMLVALWGE